MTDRVPGAHLVFLPEPMPRMVLWGEAPKRRAEPADAEGTPSVVETLRELGEPEDVGVVRADGVVETTAGAAVRLVEALIVLAGAPSADLASAPASVVAWRLAAQLALEMVVRERVVPSLVPRADGTVEARWAVSLALREDAARVAALAAAMPPAAYAVPVESAPRRRGRRRRASASSRGGGAAPSVRTPQSLLRAFLDAAADVLFREAAAAPLRRGRAASAAKAPAPPWERRFAAALVGEPSLAFTDFRERGVAEALSQWAAPASGAAGDVPRVGLRLELPPDEAESTALGRKPRGDDTFGLSYFLQAADDPSLVLPAERAWAARDGAARLGARAFRGADEHLLRGLAVAARIFPPVERSLADARPTGASLPAAEAWTFLTDAAPALVEAGLAVVLPAELTSAGRRRLRLRMRVGVPGVGAAGVVRKESAFGLAEIVDFRWEAALLDTELSAKELEALARLKAPLVRVRGRWVAVDAAELEEARRLVADGGGRISRAQAVAAALAGTARRAGGADAEVVATGDFAAALARLSSAGCVETGTPPGFVGELRPYQRRGLAWLSSLADLGFGACLADDMGLGKTIQVLAFLLARRRRAPEDARPTLLVCPTSVLGNWEREIAKFAPSLPAVRHHGTDRARQGDAFAALAPGSVVLTTYGVLRRDAPLLAAVAWGSVVLDEAQNVKNAASATARAARSLSASHRIALTGTPVENRLAELWSIVEFGNPGLLGPLEAFRRETATPIERFRDEAAAQRLRRVVAPFVLRRVKSDPSVIADLPAKNEMKVFCSLTTEQATLYRAAVEDAMAEIEGAQGIARKGRVLALITALKQICNHPAQFLGESGPLPGRSGKLARLAEMLEEALCLGDRALVFTQYREMGDRLVAHLSRELGREIPFLHGGVSRAARDEMVRRFQEEADGPCVFVLSLKAGGTGLNLTRATHVFHFDRWWNPAVEDQATDRAYRIGQKRSVQVHKFLTAGTVEEKVDRMLEDKRDLAARVVAAGESFLTELDDAALRDVFALSADAVVADLAGGDSEEGAP